MAILVVVDMQPFYKQARSRSLQARVRRAIKEHRGPICIVKFENSGEVYPGILKACRGKRKFTCLKDRDDGGVVVVGATFGEKLGRHRHYLLCGVNTAYCVISTATGILKNRKEAKVTLLMHACATHYDEKADREPSIAAAHVWKQEDDYCPRAKRRRFLRWRPASMRRRRRVR